MPNININKIIYTIRHKYLTLNNVVIAVAFFIAASWIWGSLTMMQRNYSLQKEIDYKNRELELAELQRDNLQFQRDYYRTTEYQELAAREALGKVRPGESMIILPDNTEAAKNAETSTAAQPTANAQEGSNLSQWVNFLFGGYSKSIQDNSRED